MKRYFSLVLLALLPLTNAQQMVTNQWQSLSLLPLASSPTLTLRMGSAIMQAEVADTYEKRNQGLMFRSFLPSDAGMLFVFAQSDQRCFWMKNTQIPLSLAFISEQGRVQEILDMKPHDTTIHCSKAPAKFAIEAHRGWFQRQGVHTGHAIEYQIITPFTH